MVSAASTSKTPPYGVLMSWTPNGMIERLGEGDDGLAPVLCGQLTKELDTEPDRDRNRDTR